MRMGNHKLKAVGGEGFWKRGRGNEEKGKTFV